MALLRTLQTDVWTKQQKGVLLLFIPVPFGLMYLGSGQQEDVDVKV